MPGELGREAGEAPRKREANGFRTRAMLGIDAEWGAANGLTPPLAFSHNLHVVFPRELAATQPEFFPLVEGRRLVPTGDTAYWNPDLGRPDVAQHAARTAANYLRAHPREPAFALGVNDGLVFGESPETRALVTPVRWFRDRPDYSPLVFTFMNRAAAELAKTQPDKYLGCLAYYWCEDVPPFPLLRQVVPFLTADRAQGYDPDFWKEELALQEKWGALAFGNRDLVLGASQSDVTGMNSTGAGTLVAPQSAQNPNTKDPIPNTKNPPPRLGLYDYLYGSGYLVPRIYPHLLAEHLRHARRAGFTDYYAECNPNWGLDGPMPWLAAQLIQDPEQSVDALLDEYYARYFQEVAAPMRAFFERCEKLWLAQPGPGYWLKHYRNESQVVVFPAAACAELRRSLDEATRGARGEKVKRRVELVSVAFGVTERLVRLGSAREKLVRLTLDRAAPSGAEPVWRALDAYVSARRDFVHYTVELQQSHPLAIAKLDWTDYLKNDPTAAAVLTLDHDAATARALEKIGWSEASQLDAARTESGVGSEMVRDPRFAGVIRPARVIADLEYGAALPADWTSRVEPAQHARVELLAVDGRPNPARVLRITGNKDAAILQWNPVAGGGLHRARVALRGKVSPGTIVTLTFGWLDQKEQRLGFKALRLPDGAWPEWVSLQQAGLPPPHAAWVGVGIRVQHQVAGDFIEVRDFSLLADSPSTGK